MKQALPTRLAAANVALAVASLAAFGCASGKNAADQQFAELREQVARVQADHDRFDERLGAIEAAETRRAAEDQHRAETADPQAVAERPKLRVVKVRPDGEVDEEPAGGEPEADGPRQVIRAAGKAGSREGDGGADAKRDYEAAMALVKGKKYEKAIEALDGFLGRFADGPRAEAAMFWRGECLSQKGDWARAAAQYELLLTRFPQTSKASDALLRLGNAYARTGEASKAKSAYEKLRTQFPKSDAAKQAPRD